MVSKVLKHLKRKKSKKRSVWWWLSGEGWDGDRLLVDTNKPGQAVSPASVIMYNVFSD